MFCDLCHYNGHTIQASLMKMIILKFFCSHCVVSIFEIKWIKKRILCRQNMDLRIIEQILAPNITFGQFVVRKC